VDRHEGHEALEVLEDRNGPAHPSTSLLIGMLATDAREQSGIWSTASGVLGAYRSIGAVDATRGPLLDPEEFVDDAHTLYICATGRQQALLAPLVVGLLNDIQEAAYRRAVPESPLLLALDELANIAPLPDLPQLVSEGGGQGVLTIGCLQDLSQARARWGQTADGFLSLFSTTLILGGIADRTTLSVLRDLSGHHEPSRSSSTVTRDARGHRSGSISTTTVREERLSFDEAARTRPGHALVLDADNKIGWIEQTVAYRDEPWRALIGRAAREPPSRQR
jgi:type IV secretory pathway TraG/TraD family ATPase VirD4